jgi:hypothetical protein
MLFSVLHTLLKWVRSNCSINCAVAKLNCQGCVRESQIRLLLFTWVHITEKLVLKFNYIYATCFVSYFVYPKFGFRITAPTSLKHAKSFLSEA